MGTYPRTYQVTQISVPHFKPSEASQF